MSRPNLVVVGSSNTDMVVKVSHLPAPGETVLGGEFVTAGGGKGANQAVAAARLGAAVTFVARVGADALGSAALSAFGAEGIDTRYVSVDPGAPSGVALIFVDDEGENMIAVAPGANARLRAEDVVSAEAPLSAARVLVTQLEVPLEAVFAALRAARASGVTSLLNPAPAPAEGLPSDLLALVDIINPNRTELSRLTGRAVASLADSEEAARALLDSGTRGVVVTLGAEGALVVDATGVEHVSAYRVRAIDATGAGDAFTAGLAVATARGATLQAAARYANAVAALATTRLGAQPGMPTSADVERFLAST